MGVRMRNLIQVAMKINRTVQRAVAILEFAAANPNGVSLEEICQKFSLPKTSAYDILVTLVQEEMLAVIPGTPQLYQTGIMAYRIGMSYPNADDELKLIESELKELAVASERTAFFGKLSGEQVLYILKEVPENPLITTANVGSTAPLYCTSLGKTLLAWGDEEERERLIANLTYQPRTDLTIKNEQELRDDLKTSYERGYALDFREFEDHMVCASAPVYRRDHSLVGAVSISGFYRPEDDYTKIGELIKEKAADISQLLGYRAV